MWKFSTFSEFAFYVLLLLALLPTVNSNETPTPRMCAVCLGKDCAIGVREIYPAGSDAAVWPKENSRTGIQNCSMENLKADAPCKMANGSLILQANKTLHFEGMDTYDVRRVFNSQISPCADLNLPPKPFSLIQSPIHNTPTTAASNNSGIIIGSVIGSVIIFISIGVLIWKLRNCRNGDRDGRPDGNATEMQVLNGKAANGNVNGVHREDDSVVTAG